MSIAEPVDPSDGENTPILQTLPRRPTDIIISGSEDEWDERRPSFVGFNLTGSHLKQTKETDKLIHYYNRSARVATVRELRPHTLIGNIGKMFDWEVSYKEDSELEKMSKTLRAFYAGQNELIEKYQEVDKLLDSGIQHTMIRNYSERNGHGDYGAIEELEPSPQPQQNLPLHRRSSAVPGNIDLETGNVLGYNKANEIALVNLAILINFFANIVLLLGKIVVALLTSSISIVASLLDSALDFLSTLIIYYSNKLSQSKHSKKFPVGKNRLEPIGVLVFSIIIIICFVQVGLESLQRLIYYDGGEIVEIGRTSIVIMLFTIVSKLACYIWCKSIKSSSVEALTQDALVDVVFNVFSLIMPVLGYYFQLYWFDPLGALLLSIYIITLWSMTCVEHVSNLTGRNADPEDLKVILYLCMRFAEKIDMIKDISCYHVGDSINVEVDLILDADLSIRDSHDIAEALQYTIEALPIVNVERAFVHIDYTVGNFKGHLTS
jgi:cation diffusion facilitator family transporter